MTAKNIEKSQPEINIGLFGHVDHGKTTLLEALSGKWADTHSEEIKRGITIRLGYADVIFYKCPKCNEPECYGVNKKCPKCGTKCEPIRKVSFTDAPGHETLMATMLSGAAIISGALLLVAANEECPQPQTKEHLTALKILGIENIVVVQNKIDLVSKEEAMKNYDQIKTLIKATFGKDLPIIPISAQHKINIDLLVKAIEDFIPFKKVNVEGDPIMLIARSFDINRPGTDIKELVGGVLGGALKRGKLKVGDKIEIKPGRKVEREGRVFWEPILTEIVDLKTGGFSVKEVTVGGSIGILTRLDNDLVKADNLTGNIISHVGKLPPVWNEFILEPKLLERVVGSKSELEVKQITKGEALMLNVNATSTVGIVDEVSKKGVHVKLKVPICASKEDKITISRMFNNRFRLIGYSTIKE